MSDDISIDDLLQAIYKPKLKPTPSTQGYQSVEYVEKPATVYCTTCNTEYSGTMTTVKSMDNLYDRYKMKWCPRCIASQEAQWWELCFRMRNITSKPIEI